MSMHTPTRCAWVERSQHYHNKSYSVEFRCPVCGERKRYNTNFLGNRTELHCDGSKSWTKVKQTSANRWSPAPRWEDVKP